MNSNTKLLKIILIFVSQNIDFSQKKQYRNIHQLTGKSSFCFFNNQQRKDSCKKIEQLLPSYLPPIKITKTTSFPPSCPKRPTCTNLRGLSDRLRAGRKLLLSLKSILWIRETRQEKYMASFLFSQHTIHLDIKDSKPSQKVILPRFCHHIAKQIRCVNST